MTDIHGELDGNYAQAENAEVEAGKAAFAEEQAAEQLRQQLTMATAKAVKFGVDRDWANTRLIALGAEPLCTRAAYKMNVPITGLFGRTVMAYSRTEAAALFAETVAKVVRNGSKINAQCNDNVYRIEFAEVPPTFYSGPEDPHQTGEPAPGLDGLKAGIRAMLREGVTQQGWDIGYADRTLASMGLEALPQPTYKKVSVPVSGVAEVSVLVFEGDDVQASASAALRLAGKVFIKPEEVGEATISQDSAETDEVSF